MVPNDENPHCVANYAKQEVVRKTMEVDATKVALADGKRFGLPCGVQHEAAQLGEKSSASSRLATRS
jgi:hypothetical protein